MLDLKQIRAQPEILDYALQRRGKPPVAKEILDLDTRHRASLTELQNCQTNRNALAKKFGEAKHNGADTTALSAESDRLKAEIGRWEKEVETYDRDLQALLSSLPNLPAADVPDGQDESQNKVIRTVGDIPVFDFTPKSHFDLGESLELMDFERATKLSGSRFVVMYGDLARLERALAAFMIDVHTREFGYKEVYLPLMVLEKTAWGTGHLPKTREDMFQTTQGLWLIPTAEVALTSLISEETLPEQSLPLRFTAYTPCFRAEAGAAGKDTRGMIRQHQFGKVELVSITTPQQSTAEHERMLSAAETILQRLKLPYQVMDLCTGDLGFHAEKTYDLNVWLPSQNTYREISSCSRCSDFQARRMNSRYRPQATAAEPKPALQFVHTLNGSGLAVGRTLIAIMENYQQSDGSILIPEVLKAYMGGVEVIGKEV
ncbi:MAG: serine--tRNA ligase [Alphaproteobacteria bacterium]|jgi:seryl-tRNA synthetase|nr:serine--tRNA ligase [Alphaproteobacteria bacterium]